MLTLSVKAASIAGAIFNDKDDKKGQQDSYQNHLQSIPQTAVQLSRYQQYLLSLFLHSNSRTNCIYTGVHQVPTNFLEVIKMLKEKPGFNYMEANLWNALCDTKTNQSLQCWWFTYA